MLPLAGMGLWSGVSASLFSALHLLFGSNRELCLDWVLLLDRVRGLRSKNEEAGSPYPVVPLAPCP